ncbi:MAG: GNAT family N-acetyltransferase [Pseudomonadota bacterium]
MIIRIAQPGDEDGIWSTLEPMIRAGDTYSLPHDWSRKQALAYWLGEDMTTHVAADGNNILGTYYMRTNKLGGGDHVCNCGYVVHPDARGQGLARRMGEHSLKTAKERGYRAMQFNFVVGTNAAALKLWPTLGFREIGQIPNGFRHPTHGFVNAHILYREL